MKKIIGFFKVLFTIQKIYEEMNTELKEMDKLLSLNSDRNNKYENRFMYLEKFALSLRSKPLYEIGQTIFFNINESAEKPNEEYKLQGKILGIYAGHKNGFNNVLLNQSDYEYYYRVLRTGGCCQNIFLVPESKIIM